MKETQGISSTSYALTLLEFKIVARASCHRECKTGRRPDLNISCEPTIGAENVDPLVHSNIGAIVELSKTSLRSFLYLYLLFILTWCHGEILR